MLLKIWLWLLKEQRALYTQHMIFGSGSTCTSEPVIEFWRHVRWRSSIDWFVLLPLLVTSLDRGVINHSNIEREAPGGGGHSHISDGDARRKIQTKPLRETNVGMAQA